MGPPTPTSVSLQDTNGSISSGLLLGSQRPPSTEGFPRITTKRPLLPWQAPALTASGSPAGFANFSLPHVPVAVETNFTPASGLQSDVSMSGVPGGEGKCAHRRSLTGSGRPC